MKPFSLIALAALALTTQGLASPITTDYISAPDGLTIVVGKQTLSLPSTPLVTSSILTADSAVSVRNKTFDESSNIHKQARGYWDYATSGGVVGSYSLSMSLPAKAIIQRAWIDVATAPGSSVSSNIAFTVGSASEGSAGNVLAATSFANLTAGQTIGKMGEGSTVALRMASALKLTAASSVAMIVSTGGLSTGKIGLFLDYIIGL